MASVRTQELKRYLLECAFAGRSPISTFYIGLGVGPLPAVDDTMADIAETNGPGYERIACTTPFLSQAVGTDWKVSSAQGMFLANGPWSSSDYAFLTTTLAGTGGLLLCAEDLHDPFTLVGTDSYTTSVELIERD